MGSGEQSRAILNLFNTLFKNLKLREKHWVKDKLSKEDRTELDLIVKELGNCLKIFYNVDLTKNS